MHSNSKAPVADQTDRDRTSTKGEEHVEATTARITAPPPGFTPFLPTPRHPSRAVAGLLLAAHRHADFEVLASGKVKVPSASIPGLLYTVDPGTGTCTCPAWRFDERWRGCDKHLVAAEFALDFRFAAPGISYSVEKRHDSRFGIETFDVVEHGLSLFPRGRFWSTALSLEAALMEVVDVMQDRIGEAG